jgi:hypothetical protein
VSAGIFTAYTGIQVEPAVRCGGTSAPMSDVGAEGETSIVWRGFWSARPDRRGRGSGRRRRRIGEEQPSAVSGTEARAPKSRPRMCRRGRQAGERRIGDQPTRSPPPNFSVGRQSLHLDRRNVAEENSGLRRRFEMARQFLAPEVRRHVSRGNFCCRERRRRKVAPATAREKATARNPCRSPASRKARSKSPRRRPVGAAGVRRWPVGRHGEFSAA